MTDEIKNLLRVKSAQYGIDYPTLYSIVMTESSGNPKTHANYPNGILMPDGKRSGVEDGRGLLQVNVITQATDLIRRGYTSADMFDPVKNLDFQLPELKQFYDQGKAKGLSGAELAKYTERYGQRPYWTSTVENAISKNFFDAQAQGTKSNVNLAMLSEQAPKKDVVDYGKPVERAESSGMVGYVNSFFQNVFGNADAGAKEVLKNNGLNAEALLAGTSPTVLIIAGTILLIVLLVKM